MCVCVLVFERTRATENTCRRRTRADGEQVPTENTCRRSTIDASGQQWANARREVATPFSFSLLIWGLCVYLLWEALSGKIVIV